MIRKTILILYAEIMPYNVATFNALLLKYPHYVLHVVSWGKDKKLTKYQQPVKDGIHYYDKSQLDSAALLTLFKSLSPSLILISGRMEKDYLKIALVARKENKVVVGTSDNHYTGNFRQKAAVLFSDLLYKRYFDYMLVPGIYQYEYQRRLGFKKAQILFPQYCADTALFEQVHKPNQIVTKSGILFLGRLHPAKGIKLLIEVHKELFDANRIKDKLIVVGSGILKDELALDDNHVIYHPFMSQTDVIKIMGDVKYFCLPSISEPWGVVIHEASAAGLPIVTTYNCGAASTFVKQGYNGYLFKSNDKKELENVLLQMDNKSDDQIAVMASRSSDLSKQIQSEMWANSLHGIIDKHA